MAAMDGVEAQQPALAQLALIVRGADTSRLDLTPQSGGLLAVSLGLSAIYSDDHVMLKRGMLVYDALYAWCRSCQGETHNWPAAGFIDASKSGQDPRCQPLHSVPVADLGYGG